jgi:hypothetical protein
MKARREDHMPWIEVLELLCIGGEAPLGGG